MPFVFFEIDFEDHDPVLFRRELLLCKIRQISWEQDADANISKAGILNV